uniref:Uncharacterized protein n=1 Tax=mine drainage metagenome TaxID=410659 RepID=E6PQJ3_9ZZZZ
MGAPFQSLPLLMFIFKKSSSYKIYYYFHARV